MLSQSASTILSKISACMSLLMSMLIFADILEMTLSNRRLSSMLPTVMQMRSASFSSL